MTGSNQDISDEMLTAYLDHELEPRDMARIEAALAEDTALAERLADLSLPLEQLRRGMTPFLDTAPAPMAIPPEPQRSVWPLAASLACGLAVGAALMAALSWSDRPDRSWQDYAAAYHLLYRTETLAGVSTPSDLAALSDLVGRDLAAAATAEGLSFVRAQALGYEDASLIQMAYLSDDGVPYAFCIMAHSGDAYAPEASQIEGLPTVAWSDGRHEFLLIGGDGATDLAPIAEDLRARL